MQILCMGRRPGTLLALLHTLICVVHVTDLSPYVISLWFTSICETQMGLFIRIHVTVSRHGGTVSEPSYVIKRHVSGYNCSRSNPASSYESSARSQSSFFFLRLCSHYVAINWFTLTLAPLIRHFPVVFNVMVIDLTVN